jgi:hypothetical protein
LEPESGMDKIRIRDKHPGSATLQAATLIIGILISGYTVMILWYILLSKNYMIAVTISTQYDFKMQPEISL